MRKPRNSALDGSKEDRRWHALSRLLSTLDEPILTAAEIGVRGARNSKNLLKRHPNLRMYLIDPWYSNAPHYKEVGHQTWTGGDRYYQKARGVAARYKDRTCMMRMESLDAVSWIPDNSLHMAFIDADHRYEPCLADIHAWLPKILRGGYICGHDYDYPNEHWGVRKAVHEVFREDRIHTEKGFVWWVQT